MHVKEMKTDTLKRLFIALAPELELANQVYQTAQARRDELHESIAALHTELDARGEIDDGSSERSHEEDDHDGDKANEPSVSGQLGEDISEVDTIIDWEGAEGLDGC